MTGPRPAGRPWTGSEDGQLRDMLETGMTAREIARKLKRTPTAVYAAPPEEKDIGTAALRLIRDDCQAGSVRVPDCAGRPFMRSSSLLKKVFRGGEEQH